MLRKYPTSNARAAIFKKANFTENFFKVTKLSKF